MTRSVSIRNVKILSGDEIIYARHNYPFDKLGISFLDDLSKEIRKSKDSSIYPDLLTFSFWCRNSNINNLKKKYSNLKNRFGRGLVLHIAPSNVPLNFGYTFIFGLLSGNANIIKVPSKDFPQIKVLIGLINCLFKKEEYKELKKTNVFLKYTQNNSITEYLSSVCDVRIIWGGDSTIEKIRNFPIPVRSIDFSFADRVSVCLIDSDQLKIQNEFSLDRLIKSFYNDTFIMDQNACSSPKLILWKGKSKNVRIKNRFWEKLSDLAKNKIEMDFSFANQKHLKFCETTIQIKKNIIKFQSYDNFVFRLSLDSLPKDIHKYFGNSGFFFEHDIKSLDDINHILNHKYQTMTYFGVEKEIIINFIEKLTVNAFDRVVPLGSALEIELTWDGYDMIRSLTRQVTIY
ncbi:MAG: hypothetical protein CBE24_04665 [bacterium TMED264]|nr:MAG: hypothetical protein CBE24_04665 [bacterium TMED264]